MAARIVKIFSNESLLILQGPPLFEEMPEPLWFTFSNFALLAIYSSIAMKKKLGSVCTSRIADIFHTSFASFPLKEVSTEGAYQEKSI
ncbi:MAG: hypothetical protein HQM08_22820 [Candidatus Riflebacteria bacterium]|nr:hypothetical protein [Candidatus Riflebacteria bacterium]